MSGTTLWSPKIGDIFFPGLTPTGYDGIPIGGNSPAAGAFTTLQSSGAATLASLAVTGIASIGGLLSNSVAAAVTASTTQTRVGATALTKQLNFVTTVANSGDAVKLPAAVAGEWVLVFNDGANPASVFPAGASDTIDGGSGGAAVTLTNAKRALYFCTSGTAWKSAQLGVASA